MIGLQCDTIMTRKKLFHFVCAYIQQIMGTINEFVMFSRLENLSVCYNEISNILVNKYFLLKNERISFGQVV